MEYKIKQLAIFIKKAIDKDRKAVSHKSLKQMSDRAHEFVECCQRLRERVGGAINNAFLSANQIACIKDYHTFSNNGLKDIVIVIEWLLADCSIKHEIPSVDFIIRELEDAIYHFPQLIIKNESLICVTTPDITLSYDGESVDFGRFEISIDFTQDLMGELHKIIRATAIEPVYNPVNSNVIHPHVNNKSGICFGDTAYIIKQALMGGRIKDVVELVVKLLNTYNPYSSFEELETWTEEHTTCGLCGNGYSSEDLLPCNVCYIEICANCSAVCEFCDNPYCADCCVACNLCGVQMCGKCSVECEACHGMVCENCADVCSVCDKKVCSQCKEICSSCNHSVCKNCSIECHRCHDITDKYCSCSCQQKLFE